VISDALAQPVNSFRTARAPASDCVFWVGEADEEGN
jgi:hypothetical protein